MIAHMAI